MQEEVAAAREQEAFLASHADAWERASSEGRRRAELEEEAAVARAQVQSLSAAAEEASELRRREAAAREEANAANEQLRKARDDLESRRLAHSQELQELGSRFETERTAIREAAAKRAEEAELRLAEEVGRRDSELVGLRGEVLGECPTLLVEILLYTPCPS